MAQSFYLVVNDVLFRSALRFSLLQAFLSALFTVLIALLCCPGYAQIKNGKKLIKTLLLLPQLLSQTVIVLGIFVVLPQIPLGLSAIVLAQVLMNTGFALLIMGEKWIELEAAWYNKAQLLGAKPFMIYFKIIIPQMFKSIRTVFAIVFVFSMNSLLIPLALGGGPQSTTLEVLIYEKLKAEGDWTGAFKVAIIQWLMQLLIFYLAIYRKNKLSHKIDLFYKPSNKPVFLIFTYFICLVLTLPYIDVFFTGLQHINKIDLSLLQSAFSHSVVISFLVVALCLIVTGILIFFKFSKFLTVIPDFSSLFMAVGGIYFFGNLTLERKSYFLITLALLYFLSFYLSLFRQIFGAIEGLKNKYSAPLELMDASYFLSFKKVYLPLLKKPLYILALIAFCWSMGEFAIASIMAPSSSTLPLLIQEHMGQYRIEVASSYSIILILVSFIASSMGESFFNGTH